MAAETFPTADRRYAKIDRKLKSCGVIVDKRAILRGMGRDRTTLGRQAPFDLQPPATYPLIRHRPIGQQGPSPHRIFKQADVGGTRSGLADQRGGLMVRVRIVAPGHENGAAVECHEPGREMTGDPIESGPISRRPASLSPRNTRRSTGMPRCSTASVIRPSG